MKPIPVTTLLLILIILITGRSFAADTLAPSAASGTAGRTLPFIAGDALQITPWPDTAAFPAGFYPIDGEGYVDFPIIGYVKVTTLAAEELAKLLAEKYVDFMRYPHMTIRPMVRVALNGGFYRPGLYWINPRASLWEAVQIAGGPQRSDGFKKIKWERDGTVINNNMVPLLQEGKSLYQAGFKTGDQLTVTQRPLLTGWDMFSSNVLPMITFAISTAVSALTIYNSMQMTEYYRSMQR
jgi:protein involved in polysaccharide export with SLBB domain